MYVAVLRIMGIIFEKAEIPSDFRITSIKPFHKKGDKNECGIYRGIRLAFLGSKVSSNVIFFRLRDDVDTVLNE